MYDCVYIIFISWKIVAPLFWTSCIAIVYWRELESANWVFPMESIIFKEFRQCNEILTPTVIPMQGLHGRQKGSWDEGEGEVLVTHASTYTTTARHCTYTYVWVCSHAQFGDCPLLLLYSCLIWNCHPTRFVNCVERLCSVFTHPPCDSSHAAESSRSWSCFLPQARRLVLNWGGSCLQ